MPKAVQCFLNQTYPNRELLILADGVDVRDLLPADDRIRLLHLYGNRYIGAKRNLGAQRALGELIAHWDDDDYSAPGRLSDQVARLIDSGKSVTGYHSMQFTDGVGWWRYEGKPHYAIGTSLVYRREWALAHQFTDKQVGEDNDFQMFAQQSAQIVSVDAGELMHATIHDGNTSPRSRAEGTNWKVL